MSDEKKAFTVKDRRMFTLEGELRPDRPDEPEPSVPPPPSPTPPLEPVAAVEPVAAAAGKPGPGPGPEPEPPAPESFPGAAGPEGPFVLLVMLLADQVNAMMSAGLPEPEALAGLSQIVSILEMLQHRTRGRLAPKEERVLDDVLYQLRMAYLARTQGKRA